MIFPYAARFHRERLRCSCLLRAGLQPVVVYCSEFLSEFGSLAEISRASVRSLNSQERWRHIAQGKLCPPSIILWLEQSFRCFGLLLVGSCCGLLTFR